MQISLTIDNIDRLPAGNPSAYRARDRGFSIGREAGDWILPDPDKFISGRHCEVRYEHGGFWLYDISRNGTFVNGASERVASPHRLDNGDTLRIGRYSLSVEIDASRAGTAPGYREPPAHLPHAGTGPLQHPDAFVADRSGGAMPSGREPVSIKPVPREGASFSSEPFVPVPQAQGGRAAAAPARSGYEAPRPPSARDGPSAAALLRAIAAGAGVAPEIFEQRDAQDVATEIGAVLRIVVDELAQLLKARAAAKALVKSPDRTMIGPADNNPLKFVPGSEDVLDIMFARRRSGYLDARRSIEDSFRDLKGHEFATFAAMQQALSRLLDELSPQTIEKKLPPASFASKKGRAWDAFVANWEAKEDAHENGMLDIFLTYFSEAYARAARQK